jgi:hypothetical protein
VSAGAYASSQSQHRDYEGRASCFTTKNRGHFSSPIWSTHRLIPYMLKRASLCNPHPSYAGCCLAHYHVLHVCIIYLCIHPSHGCVSCLCSAKLFFGVYAPPCSPLNTALARGVGRDGGANVEKRNMTGSFRLLPWLVYI